MKIKFDTEYGKPAKEAFNLKTLISHLWIS